MSATAALRALRSFAASPRDEARCEVCGASVPPDPHHEHLMAPGTRKLLCACFACASCFDAPGARFRRLPRRVDRLPRSLDDSDWAALGIPVRCAFFVSGATGAEAVYPSPAGPVRTALNAELWALVAARAELALEAELEAWLFLDFERRRAAFRAPLDVCFRLSGLVRARWQGLSGGATFWPALDDFLRELGGRAGGGVSLA
jgi:hypothetical protein